MARQILVPLKRRDRIEKIVPYIERIAQPGMRVVFLIPFPVDSFRWLQSDVIDEELEPEQAREAIKKLSLKLSVEGQNQLAEQKVLPARQVMDRQGVEVAVDVYSGPLKEAVKNHARNGDVNLMMAPTENGHLIRSLLYRTFRLFRPMNRLCDASFFLLHPASGR